MNRPAGWLRRFYCLHVPLAYNRLFYKDNYLFSGT